MLRRKAYDFLMDWKSRDHKSLLIKGQKHAGKTFIVEEFGKTYDHMVSVNLSEERSLRAAFKGDLDVDSIIKGLMMFRDPAEFVPGSTLLFFDEIQECPEARASLKSFTIDGRYDVVASGSLLGVNLPSRLRDSDDDEPEPLAPVGYEETFEMRSLDFEEFLWANGIPESAIADVKGCIAEKRPIPPAYLSRFSQLFRDFMIVGGMPESVQSFVETGNYADSEVALKSIDSTCKKDIIRYTEDSESIKTLECYRSIPSQLAETNKRFTYSRLSGGGSRKSTDTFGENILWIKGAGYGNFVYALEQPVGPLPANRKKDVFRVYMSDTGMLMHSYGDAAKRSVWSGDYSYNKGAATENAVAECIVKCGYVPYYYKAHKKLSMEIDFVVELKSGVTAIEVKSGKKREAPSIHKIADHFDVRRIMFENGDVYVGIDGIEHYPLFTAAFLDSMEEPWDGPAFSRNQNQPSRLSLISTETAI